MVNLKTKYERMTREEKKEIKNRYQKTEAGTEMLKRLFRLNVVGILLILYAIYLFFSHFNHLKWSDYVTSIPIALIGIFFLFMSYRLKKKVLNQFAIKNEKQKNK